MADATKSGYIHKCSKNINIQKSLVKLNTIRVTPTDPTTTKEKVILAIIKTAKEGLTGYQYYGGEERMTEFQLSSKDDYIMIKNLRNSNSIAELNGVNLKISLLEEDERIYTIRFVPPWFQEEDLHQELKLAFNQSARIFNLRKQTRKFEEEDVVTHLPEPHYWFSVAGAETAPTAIQFGRKLCYIFLKG